MRYNGVILKKFKSLQSELDALHGLGRISSERLDQDHFLKHGIERSLQICVEVIIDISNRILSLEGRPPAATSFDSLADLEALGVIASAERYKRMIQFRNFVVHRYEHVDSSILSDIVNNHLATMSDFMREIQGGDAFEA